MNINPFFLRNAFILLGIFITFLADGKPLDSEKPNIIVILVDDLGYGDLSIQGGKDPALPDIPRAGGRLVQICNLHLLTQDL